MKPESALFLRKSQEFLDKARGMLDQGWADEAGRAAYLAGFHAAQALIFERSGRLLKTHSGVQTEFALLMKDEPVFDAELRRFLGRAYNLKEAADYEVGSGRVVSPARAESALAVAQRFVAALTQLIT